MIIVIDAYNLLHAIPPYKKSISDQERIRFILGLNTYARVKGHKIVLVFDGGPYEWPYRENKKTILVIYSGIHQTADDYIKKYLDEYRSRDILLVSSDTELNQFAERLQIPSIDSTSFNQLLYEQACIKRKVSTANGEADQITKLAHDVRPDVDALMQSASKVVPIKSEDLKLNLQKKNDSKKNTLSKQERALLKKLNKL